MDNSIGKRISTRRNELGITGQQIKESIGISTGNLSGIEKGNSLPSATALIGISKILNCSIDWILTGKTSILENRSLIDGEKELLETYNHLDRRGQHRVHTVIYEEMDRINELGASDSKKVI